MAKKKKQTPLMLRLKSALITLKDIECERGGWINVFMGGKSMSCEDQIKRIETAIKKEKNGLNS